jgi:hypothetical protein
LRAGTLYDDEIEIVSYGTPLSLLGLRPPQRITRRDIVGRALTHNRGPRRMILRLRNGRTIRMPMIFRTDATFRDWFKSVDPISSGPR